MSSIIPPLAIYNSSSNWKAGGESQTVYVATREGPLTCGCKDYSPVSSFLTNKTAEHQVTFIEEGEALCKEFEQRCNVPIYQGDGTKKELMESGIGA